MRDVVMDSNSHEHFHEPREQLPAKEGQQVLGRTVPDPVNDVIKAPRHQSFVHLKETFDVILYRHSESSSLEGYSTLGLEPNPPDQPQDTS